MFITMVIFSFDNDDVVCFGNDAGTTMKVLVMMPAIIIM